jgi:hypothetical protein
MINRNHLNQSIYKQKSPSERLTIPQMIFKAVGQISGVFLLLLLINSEFFKRNLIRRDYTAAYSTDFTVILILVSAIGAGLLFFSLYHHQNAYVLGQKYTAKEMDQIALELRRNSTLNNDKESQLIDLLTTYTLKRKHLSQLKKQLKESRVS